jgi:putative hydrolase of the HAD superfamily
MQYKAILLDFDGVISPGRFFSDIYAEKYGVDARSMDPFFDNMAVTAVVGRGDLKDQLTSVLKDWKWEGNVDELIDYWLKVDSDVDPRFIPLVEKLKEKGYKVYLATDQEQRRSDFIWNERKLNEWLDGKFVSCEIGHSKKEGEFFTYIVNQLGLKPDEILFFDDSEKKVNVAKSSGIHGHLFSDFDSFNSKLQELISL